MFYFLIYLAGFLCMYTYAIGYVAEHGRDVFDATAEHDGMPAALFTLTVFALMLALLWPAAVLVMLVAWLRAGRAARAVQEREA